MSTYLSYTGSQKLWNSEKDIEHVINDLDNNLNTLTTLQLSGNTLGVKAAEKLIEPLSKQSKLKRLLWNDLFTGRLKSEISVSLKSLSSGLMRAQVQLVELDLSDNAFGPNGVVGVTELLASPCCYTLKTLNMNNQGLGHQGCRQLVDALKEARINSNKKGMNLEVFIAGRNRLENVGIKMLTEVFADGMNSLKKLVLLQNGIGIHGIEGVENLILSLKNHANIEVINISDNTIKPEGVKLLSKILPDFEHLEELHLSDCLIYDNGLDYLTKTLDLMSSNLKTISISGNEIHGRCATKFISTVVKSKHLIEKINITENDIKQSFLCEIKDIMTEHDKSDVLVEEEKDSDVESEDEESEDYDSSDNSNSSNEDKYSDEFNESESFKVNKELVDDEKSSTGKKSLFIESKSNEFVKSNLFSKPNQTNIFKSNVSNAPNIFGVPSTKPFSFLEAATNSESSNSNDGINANNQTFVFYRNIESSKNSLFNESITNATAKSSLFSQQNIVKSSDNVKNLFGLSMKPFSFMDAATSSNTIEKEVNQYVYSNLQSISLMSIKDFTFNKKTNVEKISLDSNIYKTSENNPENAIRIGLILCKETSTFDIGVSLISYLIASKSSWAKAINAILVEMNCIKSEDKKFVPFSEENDILPIKVLENVLEKNFCLSNEVRTNLSVVLKNLTKKSNSATDDLLKKLECIKI